MSLRRFHLYVFRSVLAGLFAATAAAGRAPIDGVFNLRAARSPAGVLIQWQAEGAANLVAYQLQRAPSPTGPWTALHHGWLTTAPEEPAGYALTYLDTTAPGTNIVYRLTARNARGATRDYGPVAVIVDAAVQVNDNRPIFSAESRAMQKAVTAPLLMTQPLEALPHIAMDEPPPSKLKIRVRDTGLYFLSAQDIATVMGWTTNDVAALLARSQLRLSNRGRKTAYTLAPADRGLYFYNESRPDIYSGEEVYWLERGHGLALPPLDGAISTNASPADARFVDTSRFESNLTFSLWANSDPDADVWYWQLLGGSDGTVLPAHVPVATGEAGRLTVRMLSATSIGFSGEHHVIFAVNGTSVGEVVWEGIAIKTWSFPIPAGVLSNGLNQVRVQKQLDSGIAYSFVFLDRFEIQYPRSYTAAGDALRCPGTVAGPVTATGFSEADVLVFDVSDPALPRPLGGVLVQPTNSAFAVSFLGAGTNASYFICARSAVRPATNRAAWFSASLRSSTNRADYIAFSVPALTNTLGRLMAHRQAGGWTPKVVLTEQLYDEFTDGRLSPYALRRCLAHARAQWSTPPTHAVLVGTGSFDYRDYNGLGGCLVPTLLAPTPDGMFASDNQLADVQDNDGVPDLAIGRLPTATPAALSNMVDKIIAHDTAVSGAWQSNVVFAADNTDEAGNFTASSEAVAGLLPAWLTVQTAHLETQSVAAVRTIIRTGLNAGLVWLNYFGHGGWYGLAQEQILAQADFSSLTNRTTPCVLTAMTCLINRFELPGYVSFSEQLLLNAPGGVVAVWSATGLSNNSAAEALDRAFYQHRYQAGVGTLGESARRALQSGCAQGVPRFELDIMTVLGDPALPLR